RRVPVEGLLLLPFLQARADAAVSLHALARTRAEERLDGGVALVLEEEHLVRPAGCFRSREAHERVSRRQPDGRVEREAEGRRSLPEVLALLRGAVDRGDE